MGFYNCVHVFHAAIADFCGVFVKYFVLCPVGKCFSISFINCPPTFDLTLALNGGLNHIIFLGRFLLRFVLGSDSFFENCISSRWALFFSASLYGGAALLKISSLDDNDDMRFSTAIGICLIIGGGCMVGVGVDVH